MTRWGFISDVHGNLPALERAIEACRSRGVDHLVYLGDSLGRGDPDACVRVIRETAQLSVVGNRDLDWADRVGEAARNYVMGLPRLAEGPGFVAAHGDARLTPDLCSDDRRRGFARAYRWLTARHHRLLFFGHTHQARAWRKRGPDFEPEPLAETRAELPALPGVVYLLNVGTTGLPFPGKGPPSCTIFDDAGWFEHVVLEPEWGRERRRDR